MSKAHIWNDQGRVACEVNAGDELVTTEIIFAGVLSELCPEEAVAVLSALVFQVPFPLSLCTSPNPLTQKCPTQKRSLHLTTSQLVMSPQQLMVDYTFPPSGERH